MPSQRHTARRSAGAECHPGRSCAARHSWPLALVSPGQVTGPGRYSGILSAVALAPDLSSETAYCRGLIPIDVFQAAGCRAGGNARSGCRAGAVHLRAATSCGHTITGCYTITVGRVVVGQRAASTCRWDRGAGHRRRTRRELAAGLPRRAGAAATGQRRPHRFRRPDPPRRADRA